MFLVSDRRGLPGGRRLGGGKRFLPDDGAKRPLRLVDNRVTTTGAILATYETAG